MLKYKRNPPTPLLKLALDLGPLLVFFLSYRFLGLIAATGALMAATLLSLGIVYALERRVAPMPVITAIAVAIFGGLTLWLQDETFIKMKPTIVNLIFAAALIGGNVLGRPTLQYLLGDAMKLSATGWRQLGFRWGVFFIFLAALNEFIWRSFSTAFWVDFKVFGMFTLTLLFTLSQVPLLKRHMIEEQ